MSVQYDFPNYYELLRIGLDATEQQIRAGHVHAVAQDSSALNRKQCDAALAVLQEEDLRQQYDEELIKWQGELYRDGENKATRAVQTIQEADNKLRLADGKLKQAQEIVWQSKHNKTHQQLMKLRPDIHTLCHNCISEASKMRLWAREILELCQEADRCAAHCRYLMETKVVGLEQQIRTAERTARDALARVEELVATAQNTESEFENLLSNAPKKSVIKSVASAAQTTGNAVAWTKNTIETTVKMIGWGILLFIVGFFVLAFLWGMISAALGLK